MKKENAEKLRFVDALAKEVCYAVLTKDGRVQVLVRPSSKQLRKRGKRGWHLYHALDGADTTIATVLDTLRQVLTEMESPAVNGDSMKEHRPKKAAVRS
jgi:hypothetical protein